MNELLFALPAVFGVVVNSAYRRARKEVPVYAASTAVRLALQQCGMSEKEAADLMDISPSELSTQLTRRGVNAARLHLLGTAFLEAYARALMRDARAIETRVAELEKKFEHVWAVVVDRVHRGVA